MHRPERRLDILAVERVAGRNDEYRHVLAERLGDAGIGVLDPRPVLGREHAVLFSLPDARKPVGDADPDALLAAQDGPDIERRAGLDQRVARVAGKKFRPLAPEDLRNDIRAVHNVRSLKNVVCFCGA